MTDNAMTGPASPGRGGTPAGTRGLAPGTTLVALVALVVLAFIAAAGWVIERGYGYSLDVAEARNIRLLQAFDEAAGRFFREIEQAMLLSAADFFRESGQGAGQGPGQGQGADGGRHGHPPLPFGIVDAAGRVALASDERIPALLERAAHDWPAQFRPPSRPEAAGMFVLQGAKDPAWAGDEAPILLGRRVSGPGGGFAVVVSVADGARLRALTMAGVEGDGAHLALVTTAGDLLFSSPAEDSRTMTALLRQLLPPDRLSGAFFGSQRGRIAKDGAKWLLAFHRLGRTPLVVTVAVARDEALRPWRVLAWGGIVIVLSLSALVGGLAAVHLRSVGRARRDLELRVGERTLKERRAAERLLAAERLTHLGHWEHDLVGESDHWSAEAYQILGLRPDTDSIDLSRVLSGVHPADSDNERTARILALAGVKPYDVQVRIVRPDGTVRHVQLQAEVLRTDQGEPVRLIGTILDVTDRVSIEACLRESEERYRKTFEAAQDALFLVDRDSGTVIEANGAASGLYGYERGELPGMAWERLGAGVSGVGAGPTRHRRRDGTELFVELSAAKAELSGRGVEIVAVRDVTARVLSEQQLARTTERLTDAERIAHLGYWDWNRAARTHHWSEEHWRILGLDPATTRPGYRSFIALVHPEDRARVDAFPAALRGDGQMGSVEFRIRRPDGVLRHIRSTCRGERDESGTLVRLFAIHMDVTERKAAEIALAESHAALTSVIEATQEDSVMLVGAEGIVQIANDRAARSFGRSAGAVCGQRLAALLSPDSWQTWRRRLYQVIALGQPLRFEHSRGGAVFDAHLSPALGHDGQLVGVAVFERDITARKRAEVNLRLLTRAIEQSPLSVVITERDGRIVYVNPHFETSSGYGAEEVIGKDPSLFKSGYTTHSEYRRLWETIGAGRVWQGEFHNRMKCGELHWESASIAPVRDEQGTITHFVAVKEDITRRKLAEIELLAAKERAEAASLSKSQFLATISHELRTPLNAILGFSEVIQNGLRTPEVYPRIGDYARHIHSNGTHLLGLINDLLDLAKIEAGKFELHEQFVDLEEVTFAAMEMLRSRAEAGRLMLTAEMAPGLPLLHGDDRALRHILINLLSNAVKFTPEGGRVTVRGEIDGNGLVALSVADTGIGIAAKDIAKVLEPFGQVDNALSRRHDGTGLGLPLCRSLVEMHGGHLEIASTVDVGTVVTVRFPRNRIVVAGTAPWTEHLG